MLSCVAVKSVSSRAVVNPLWWSVESYRDVVSGLTVLPGSSVHGVSGVKNLPLKHVIRVP